MRSGGSSLRSTDQCTTIIAHPSARIINAVLPAGWWSLVWREFHAACMRRFIAKRSQPLEEWSYQEWSIYAARCWIRLVYKNLRYYRYVSSKFPARRTNRKENEQRTATISDYSCLFRSTFSELPETRWPGSPPSLSIFDAENSRATSLSISSKYIDHSLFSVKLR